MATARTPRPQPQALKEALSAFAPKLEELMGRRKLSEPGLEREMKRRGRKVATKTINNIVNGRHSPELGNLANIAEHFGVPLWVMFIPDLEMGFLDEERLAKLVKLVTDYCATDPSRREHIESMAAAQRSLGQTKK